MLNFAVTAPCQHQDMQQSRLMSLVESVSNVGVGFVLAILTQSVVFPYLGVRISTGENVFVAGIFTGVSIARSYALRRLFEVLRR